MYALIEDSEWMEQCGDLAIYVERCGQTVRKKKYLFWKTIKWREEKTRGPKRDRADIRYDFT